jgi:hypothetical protein
MRYRRFGLTSNARDGAPDVTMDQMKSRLNVTILCTGLVLLIGLVKTPRLPTNDPALFEYYGNHL